VRRNAFRCRWPQSVNVGFVPNDIWKQYYVLSVAHCADFQFINSFEKCKIWNVVPLWRKVCSAVCSTRCGSGVLRCAVGRVLWRAVRAGTVFLLLPAVSSNRCAVRWDCSEQQPLCSAQRLQWAATAVQCAEITVSSNCCAVRRDCSCPEGLRVTSWYFLGKNVILVHWILLFCLV
jgi:hypothetical protein